MVNVKNKIIFIVNVIVINQSLTATFEICNHVTATFEIRSHVTETFNILQS